MHTYTIYIVVSAHEQLDFMRMDTHAQEKNEWNCREIFELNLKYYSLFLSSEKYSAPCNQIKQTTDYNFTIANVIQ